MFKLPKLGERGVVHLLVPLILILGLVTGVYLLTSGNPLKLFSKASNPPIVFKSLDDKVLPLKNGIYQTTSSSVKAELTSPLGSPATVSGPTNRVGTVSYRAAFNPADLNNVSWSPYLKEPAVYSVDLKNTPAPQFYWVEFKDKAGRADRRSAQIQIVPAGKTASPASFSCDANGDGQETNADGDLVKGCWNKPATGSCAGVDVDGNGKIDILDVQKYSGNCPQIFGASPSPVPNLDFSVSAASVKTTLKPGNQVEAFKITGVKATFFNLATEPYGTGVGFNYKTYSPGFLQKGEVVPVYIYAYNNTYGGTYNIKAVLTNSSTGVSGTQRLEVPAEVTVIGPSPVPSPDNSFKQAMDLNGTDSCAEVSDPTTNLYFTSLGSPTNFTIEGWFRLTRYDNTNYIIAKESRYAGGYNLPALTIGVRDGKLEFALNTYAGYSDVKLRQATIRGKTQIEGNRWYHFAAIRGGYSLMRSDIIRLMVNGKEDADPVTLAPTNSSALDSGFTIGCQRTTNSPTNSWLSHFFQGEIDEVRVSNGVRYTDNFIPPTKPFFNDDSTLAVWHLDGLQPHPISGRQVILDSSPGIANSAIPRGIVTFVDSSILY